MPPASLSSARRLNDSPRYDVKGGDRKNASTANLPQKLHLSVNCDCRFRGKARPGPSRTQARTRMPFSYQGAVHRFDIQEPKADDITADEESAETSTDAPIWDLRAQALAQLEAERRLRDKEGLTLQQLDKFNMAKCALSRIPNAFGIFWGAKDVAARLALRVSADMHGGLEADALVALPLALLRRLFLTDSMPKPKNLREENAFPRKYRTENTKYEATHAADLDELYTSLAEAGVHLPPAFLRDRQRLKRPLPGGFQPEKTPNARFMPRAALDAKFALRDYVRKLTEQSLSEEPFLLVVATNLPSGSESDATLARAAPIALDLPGGRRHLGETPQQALDRRCRALAGMAILPTGSSNTAIYPPEVRDLPQWEKIDQVYHDGLKAIFYEFHIYGDGPSFTSSDFDWDRCEKIASALANASNGAAPAF